MGIDICSLKTITLNETHEKRLVTNVSKNPTYTEKSTLKISCIYRRTKLGDYARDGNPFIYALKNKKGFSISNRELFRFRTSLKIIIEKITQKQNIDYIVTMPSSHQVAKHFGTRIARLTEATLVNDYFSKETIGNILNTFDLSSINNKDKSLVTKTLSTYKKLDPADIISLKNIDNKIRHYFSPVVLNSSYSGPRARS